MMESNGIVPVLPVNGMNGYGYGDGCGFGGGAWFWVIIIVVFLAFAGRGHDNHHEGAQIANGFLTRDVFSTNTDVLQSSAGVSKEVLENRYTTQLGLAQLQAQNQNCCCETQKEIMQNRYDNAIGQCGIKQEIAQNRYDALLTAKDAQMQLADCCCKLEAKYTEGTQKILDWLCNDKIQQLRDQVYTTNLALNNTNLVNSVTNTLRPYPSPAYITCSPYESAFFGSRFNGGCGCNQF